MSYTNKLRSLRFVMVLFLASSSMFFPAQSQESFNVEEALEELSQLKKEQFELLSESRLNRILLDVAGLEKEAQSCFSLSNEQLKTIKSPLDILGKVVEGEPESLSLQRKELEAQKASAEARLSVCQLVALRSDEVGNQVRQVIQKRKANRLFAQAFSVVDFSEIKWSDFKLDISLWTHGVQNLIQNPSFLLTFGSWALFSLLLYFLLRFWLLKHLDLEIDLTFWSRLKGAIATATVRNIYGILLMAGASFLAWKHDENATLINYFLFGTLAVQLLLFGNNILLSTRRGGREPLIDIPIHTARWLKIRLDAVLLILFAGVAFYISWHESRAPDLMLFLVENILVTILAIEMLGVLILTGRIAHQSYGIRAVRFVFMLLWFGTTLAMWIGYRNFGVFLLQSTVITKVMIFGVWVVINLLKDFFQGVIEGNKEWQANFRAALGFKPHGKPLSLYWLYLILMISLWAAFVMILLWLWGLPETQFLAFYNRMFNGFQMGQTRVIPIHIIAGIIIFTFVLLFLGWVKDTLIKRSLIRTGVERGAREAILSISGYIGFTLALVGSLAVSGVDFQSLALIAGALSVGIGFGLQNVVNNFVSGLILLFERPIKTGDWIVVGATEGYVKKISIRSTIIQTFDRSDVIVPNSELISQQVTNWMFKENFGRIHIAVGVAHGSDTDKVRQVLLEVAEDHPEVITNGLTPGPDVLFVSFGDSALQFKLRVFIFDIDKRFRVSSDINFSIDKAFRKHGIEIPFPQRDLHIKSVPDDRRRLPRRRGNK